MGRRPHAESAKRGTSTQRGYDARWTRLRTHKLRADPLCEHCHALGKVVPAQDVDHIQPFNGRGDPLRLDWSNLQSLCRRCHNRKTHGARPAIGLDGYPIG